MTSPGANTLLELAERVEAATGPDRELDLAIDCHARPDEWSASVKETLNTGGPLEWFSDDELPRYTASLDAAMTLVPEGLNFTCGFRADNGRGGGVVFTDPDRLSMATGATPAHALTAACLRARAAKAPAR